jgi:N,N'-diacetyllegionaminate synthase
VVTLVIAEVGSNHLGKLSKARELVDIAYECGADIAKFQWIDRNRIWEKPYSRPKWTEVEFGFLWDCYQYCESIGIEFMCTPTSPEQVGLLNPMVSRWKIASSHIGDHELCEEVFETEKPVIASTGLLSPREVWKVQKWATPLHCVVKYPAMPQDYALMEWLDEAGLVRSPEHQSYPPWGISDHSIGIGTSIAAVALGASVVEKHIALSQQPKSPDDGPHALRPTALKAFISGIRQAESARDGIRPEAVVPSGRVVWV